MNSYAEVWAKVCKMLEQTLPSISVETWFGECTIMDLTADRLILHARSDLTRETILNRYSDLLKSTLRELYGTDFQLTILIDGEMMDQPKPAEKDPFSGDVFTFDKFIVGPSNRLAFAAAKSVSESPASNYNPLLIYGDSGLGKTHLIYSIAYSIRHLFPNYRIVYIKGDDFTNELVNAIQTGRNSEFREKYRQADLLLVDDIQFIAGKVQTQEEFFHTFNTLYESGKQIVLTSDRPPREMLRLEDRLRSRFEGGLLVDIQPPDYETRVAIINTKAKRMGFTLPIETVEYIADNIKANIRQIEGILKKIQAYIALQGAGVISMELIRRITKEVIDSEKAYTPDYIIAKIADYYNITPEEIMGKSKIKNVSNARHIAIYLIRSLTGLTLEDIGKVFGRDHSTVLHSIRKVEESLPSDPETADIVRDITANISNK